ncbi:terminase small subunit [Desulfobacter postgatei]|uniref:terminase small subunit n=1 Tax=Desulfobacter postgatei TaxID=2293 RepID=UPI002FDA1E38
MTQGQKLITEKKKSTKSNEIAKRTKDSKSLKKKTNQSKAPVKTGRPMMWPDPEALDIAIAEYFADCDERGAPYTIPGLAYSLGFIDRRALIAYAGRPEFSDTIKRARARIERQRVENLVAGNGSTPGQIFDLKNNFGYADKIESTISGPNGGPVEVRATKFVLVEPGTKEIPA